MIDLGRVLTPIVEALDAGSYLVLLTDFDGTLTPIVAEPARAVLAPDTVASLRILSTSSVARIGIISGRGLDDLRRRVGLATVVYAGCHGLEIEGPGLAYTHGEANDRRAAMQVIADALARRVSELPGVQIEHKGLSVAVHYRNAEAVSRERLGEEIDRALCGEPRFHILRGKKVVEILPTAGWNKGQCALRIRDDAIARTRMRVLVVYMGDDATDEVAFSTLGRTAITVRVGSRAEPTLARFRLPGVQAVNQLLSSLALELMARSRP